MAKETPPAAPVAATAVAPSWLGPEMTTLAAAYKAGRLPHGLLLHEAPGAGGDWLAKWLASLVFCQNAAQAPCGKCQGCHRVATAQHPDLVVLQPIEESRQIRIEQIRELAAELALTAHQGSYKVAVITPADTLNRFAANALLKTLEEPPARTLLMLVVTQPSRLPATILSRCQRIRIRAPARQEAVAWLEASRGAEDWNAVLDTLGEAPMLAADVDAKAVVQVGQEVRRTLEEATTGGGDPVATAERWSRTELPLRLRCIENWLTERIRAHSGNDGFLTKVGAAPYLPRHDAVLNMGHLFELVDGVRELKSALDTPINRGLALESILRRFAPGARIRT
ncbi:MAG TPA: DNA polymerase III subunit delta' [Steroidobacteraceae bacterium]|nr:DNA polymerase III subunit delta' [Steroidobacteraceae bacterium]